MRYSVRADQGIPLLWLIIVLLAGAVPLFGQEATAVLGGKVFDPQGKVIVGATVTVTAEDTGVVRTAITNKAGDWRVESLVLGHYHFQASSPGFSKAERRGIELQVSDQKFLDVTLNVGSTTDNVVVSSEPPLIDTTSAVSGTVINDAQLEELPSQSNVATLFAGLAPGVFVSGANTGGLVSLWSNVAASGITANFAGSGTASVNYLIEGMTNTNAAFQAAFVPPMAAIREFRVLMNAYDASVDRAAGATVDMTLKSGTSGYHGVLYESNQNSTLNASRYEDKNGAVAPVHKNEWGATVGGPIFIPKLYNGRKKSFFFFSYDGVRNKAPANTGTMSLPTMLERSGDFSQSFTTQTVNKVTTIYKPYHIYDPTLVNKTTGARQEFAGDVIPKDRIDPIAKALFALMPPPDNAGDGSSTDANNYHKREVQDDKFYSLALRLDNQWNNNQNSFAELRYNNWSEISLDPFGPDNILNGTLQTRKNYGLTLNHVMVLRPTLLLTLTGNITSYQNTSKSTSAGVNAAAYGFSQDLIALQQLPSLPQIIGVGSGEEGSGFGTNQAGTYDNDNIFEGKVVFAENIGNHSFHYGAHYIVQQQGTGSLGASGGSFTFANSWTTQNPLQAAGIADGANAGSFLLGLPTSGSIPTTATAMWSQPFLGVYFQDDWRATTHLTLNLGLRWDHQFALTDRYNRFFSRFDPNVNIGPVTNYAQPNYAALISGSSTNTGVQLLQQNRPDVSSFVARGAILYAGMQGTSRAVSNTSFKDFQPRVGFAYQLYPKTVFRGGVGRFTEATFIASHGNQLGYSQTTPMITSPDGFLTIGSTLDSPFPSGKVAVTGNENGELTSVGSVTSFASPNVPRQYTDTASLFLEQQVKNYLFEVGGVAALTHGLPVSYSIDNVSIPAWHAAYDPEFNSAGHPVDTLPGDTLVANPFYGAPYITAAIDGQSTISAYNLLRPNPLVSSLTETIYNGRRDFYALEAKVERRFNNGFGLLQSFTWGKSMQEDSYFTPAVYSEKLHRELSSSDQRFQFAVSPTYVLPFGRKGYLLTHTNGVVDRIVSGWTISGAYVLTSGTPVVMPTNTAFYEGGDPSLGKRKTKSEWFDTSKFEPFPSRSTNFTQQPYPAWTGVQNMPGYSYVPSGPTDPDQNGVYQDFHTWVSNNTETFGDVRNPYSTNLDIGLRKNIQVVKDMRLELRIDAFNAFNHPIFAGPGLTPGSTFFGALGNSSPANLTQANNPRAIQLAGKFYF